MITLLILHIRYVQPGALELANIMRAAGVSERVLRLVHVWCHAMLDMHIYTEANHTFSHTF